MKHNAVKYIFWLLVILIGAQWGLCIPANAESVEESGTVSFAAMDLDVSQTSNNGGSFDIGEIHTWILHCGIPEDIAGAGAYEISNPMADALTFQRKSLSVTLCNSAGHEKIMHEGAHYLMPETAGSQGFSLALTQEGIRWVGENLGDGPDTPEIRLEYTAYINSSARLGETISNQATLRYADGAGVQYHVSSDIAQVQTGGICLKKTDELGNPLPGAVFRIARLATVEELENATVPKEILVLEEEVLTVVYLDFFPTKELDGEKVARITTGEDGSAALCGLKYGTYYILEVQSPQGYNLLTQPIAVNIDSSSHITREDGWTDPEGNPVDHTLHVTNSKYILPDTGGIGTTVFTVTGSWIIVCCLVLLILNRKKI